MKTTLLLFALALALPFAHAAELPPTLPEKTKFHLFLLAGQSNMAGRGKLDDESQRVNPRVLVLGKDKAWRPAVDPLHWDKPSAGTGVGKPFGEIVAARQPEIAVGLIPAAAGGSSIRSWVPGGYHDQTKSHPYDDAIERAKRAQQDGTLKAILWHQGESDATPERSADYAQRLEEVFTRLRTELAAPDVPIIIGQLGRFPAKPWTPGHETVDAAHRALAAKMKNVFFVTAEGFKSIGDNLHFDTPSLREFAKRYAAAYLDHRGSEAPAKR